VLCFKVTSTYPPISRANFSSLVTLGFLGVASQLALKKLIALLEENQISKGVMPIATGILMDKYCQLE
jgi:hypothetical protein